jgi:hypothetical protein
MLHNVLIEKLFLLFIRYKEFFKASNLEMPKNFGEAIRAIAEIAIKENA